MPLEKEIETAGSMLMVRVAQRRKLRKEHQICGQIVGVGEAAFVESESSKTRLPVVVQEPSRHCCSLTAVVERSENF
jgi:hypothetical protein